MDQLVAVDAVDLDRRIMLNEKCCHLVVRSVGKVGWIHLVFALSAGEALPVVASWLRDLLLRLKHLEQQLVVKLGSLVPIFHLSRASRADVCTTFLALKLGAVGLVQGCLRLVPVRVRVAVLAVDLGNQGSDGDVMQDVTHIVVWSLRQRLVIQRALALHALKTLAVVRSVPSSEIFQKQNKLMLKHFYPVQTYVAVFTRHVFFNLLPGHFLRLKDLASTTRARVLVLRVARAHDDRRVSDHLGYYQCAFPTIRKKTRWNDHILF